MKRRILCAFPRYAPSFGTFEHAYALRGNTWAFMPPQGILVIAASVPADWEVRFLDENMGPASENDFAWADAVFVSGMHVQRPARNSSLGYSMPILQGRHGSAASRPWNAHR